MKKEVEHSRMPEWGNVDADQGLFNLKKKR